MVETTPLTAGSMRVLLTRAAHSVAAAIAGRLHEATPPPEAELARGGGVFVTLKHQGNLAGCIGFVQAPPPLWEAVARAARAAALHDVRFPRLTSADLDETHVEVSVLSELVPIEARAFRPGEHGLILRCSEGEGLLLPQVATEHDLDREGFLRALCQKAGVPDGTYETPGCELLAFTVQKDDGPLRRLVGGGPAA